MKVSLGYTVFEASLGFMRSFLEKKKSIYQCQINKKHKQVSDLHRVAKGMWETYSGDKLLVIKHLIFYSLLPSAEPHFVVILIFGMKIEGGT